MPAAAGGRRRVADSFRHIEILFWIGERITAPGWAEGQRDETDEGIGEAVL